MVRAARAMALLAVAGCHAAAPTLEVHELRGEALGTTWMVKWRGASPGGVREAVERALDEVDRRMSTFRDDSELAAIRRADGPVPVSEETAEVVEEALRLAEATGGAFDPTVQPLVELWGIHGPRRTAPPTDAEIAAATARVGWHRVRLGRDPEGRPTIDAGGTALDLSAIAKGHAVDRVSHALSALHLPDHLVEVGGEVRAMGRGPAGPWRLGIDRPVEGLAPGQQLAGVAVLTNVAMATSGNYRNAYEVEGQRVVHTLDPRTGRPALGRVASATVVAPDCRTADGWATALMVLGPDQGLPLVEARPDLDALLLLAGPDGRFEAVRSSGMEPWLAHGETSGGGRLQ